MIIPFRIVQFTATGPLTTDPVNVRLLSEDGNALNLKVSAATAASLQIGQTVNITVTPAPV